MYVDSVLFHLIESCRHGPPQVCRLLSVCPCVHACTNRICKLMFLLPVGGSSILGNMLLGTTVKIARKLSVVSNCHYSLSSIIGLVVNSPKEKTFQQWQQAVNESWFSSQSAFLANVAYAPIKFSKPFEDTPMTRAMGIFAHFGLVRRYTTCIHPGCNSPAKIHVHKRSDNGQLSYTWTCGTSGHNHMHEGPMEKAFCRRCGPAAGCHS